MPTAYSTRTPTSSAGQNCFMWNIPGYSVTTAPQLSAQEDLTRHLCQRRSPNMGWSSKRFSQTLSAAPQVLSTAHAGGSPGNRGAVCTSGRQFPPHHDLHFPIVERDLLSRAGRYARQMPPHQSAGFSYSFSLARRSPSNQRTTSSFARSDWEVPSPGIVKSEPAW